MLGDVPELDAKYIYGTGCSLNFVFFSKNSRKFATSPSPALYTRIALRALKVSYSDVGEEGVTVNCEKSTIFPEHPVWAGFIHLRNVQTIYGVLTNWLYGA